jgi:outer membrane lipoprotein LolB
MPLPKFLLLLLFIVMLGACSTTRPIKPLPGSINEAQHQLTLAQIQHWQVEGRIAFKSSDEKFSANLNWQQDAAHYDIKLSSFIGTSIMHMQGKPGEVLLQADDHSYQDSDASRLITSVTGWNIPVEQLPAWLKGQVNKHDRVIFSKEGLLQQLRPQCKKCDAWSITYSAYKQVDEIWLPHQIQLNNLNQANNLIKIRINQWKLN